MGADLNKAIEIARRRKMSGEERYEQRINFCQGNLPEEMALDPVENMIATDARMRSFGGWGGSLEPLR